MNLDRGPCFGMEGHPRRDTDVILRLPKSTIEDLSFYIGFVKEFMVKTIVVDETMTFGRISYRSIELNMCFDSGILLGLFRH